MQINNGICNTGIPQPNNFQKPTKNTINKNKNKPSLQIFFCSWLYSYEVAAPEKLLTELD